MNPTMQKLVKEHLALKRELGEGHPKTVGALERVSKFQQACPHAETKPVKGGGRMCANCNLPANKFPRR